MPNGNSGVLKTEEARTRGYVSLRDFNPFFPHNDGFINIYKNMIRDSGGWSFYFMGVEKLLIFLKHV